MAHSNILGGDELPAVAPGHDAAALGPSDSSDTGSDIAGLDRINAHDPAVPVDVATDPDSGRPATTAEAVIPGADTDAVGTGERRTSADDADLHEASDLLPDQIIEIDEAGRERHVAADFSPDDLIDGDSAERNDEG